MFAETFSISFSGVNLKRKVPIFINAPGTILSLPFSDFSIAYLATSILLSPCIAKLAFATLLNSVSTGPGHKQDIFTFEFFSFSS